MSDLPDGLVTFLFTDVQGSTRMWEESPDLMMRALEQHDEAIDAAVDAHGGVSVKPRGEGDSRFVVFDDAMNSVAAVAEMQRKLAATDWATPQPILVRPGSSTPQTGHFMAFGLIAAPHALQALRFISPAS